MSLIRGREKGIMRAGWGKERDIAKHAHLKRGRVDINDVR